MKVGVGGEVGGDRRVMRGRRTGRWDSIPTPHCLPPSFRWTGKSLRRTKMHVIVQQDSRTDRQTDLYKEGQKDTRDGDRDKETDKRADRHRQTELEAGDRDKERQRQRETETKRDRDKERQRQRERHGDTERQRLGESKNQRCCWPEYWPQDISVSTQF